MRVRSVLGTAFLFFLTELASSPASAAVPVYQWSKSFGVSTTGFQQPMFVAVDGSNNVYLTGFFGFGGTIDFGGGPFTTPGVNGFLAKFAPDGTHLWSKRFGSATVVQDVTPYGIAVGSSGDVLITGTFDGSVDFGGGTLVATAGSNDVFMAKFDTNGNHIWSQRYGGSGLQQGTVAAFDASGNMFVAGYSYNGSVDFGGGPLTTTFADAWVVKLDASGAHVWSRRIGDVSPSMATAKYQDSRGIAVDGSGSAIITGSWGGKVDFGAGPINAVGDYSGYVVKYDAGGAYQWNRTFGDPAGSVTWNTVAIDGSDNVSVAGDCTGTFDFGGGPLTGAGSDNAFIFSLDSSGAHRWSHVFSNPSGFSAAFGVAANAAGDVSITGDFTDTVNFGGGTIANQSGDDLFLAKFDTNGAHTWSQGFGPGSAFGQSTAMTSSGEVLVTGQMQGGPVNFGGGPLTNQSQDGFLAKFGQDSPIPVLISRFNAVAGSEGVEVRWELRSDESVESFVLYRREGTTPNSVAIAQGAVNATTHSYLDRSVEPGKTYHYELLLRTGSGNEIRSPVATATAVAFNVALGQNHPNPFNPTTTIEYTVGVRSSVVVGIYSSTGVLVARLDEGVRAPGKYRVDWNGRDADGHTVGSGVYFYRLEGVSGAETRKMVLLK